VQKPRQPASNGNGVRARLIARGFQILFQLAGRPGGASLGEVSRLTGLSRATALRILRTLGDLDVVSLDPGTRTYRLGPAACRLGIAAGEQLDVSRAARPVLEALQTATGETVCLFRRQGAERVCIAAVTSEQDLKYSMDVGQRRPLLRGAPGKALIAHMDADARESLLATLRPAEARALIAACRHVRETGVAVSADEVVRGGTAIAAPVFGPDGRARAVLAVLAPSARLDTAAVRRTVALVRTAAREITERIGGVTAAPAVARRPRT
jgi:DNA-binding IclR family transcriptional regulator